MSTPTAGADAPTQKIFVIDASDLGRARTVLGRSRAEINQRLGPLTKAFAETARKRLEAATPLGPEHTDPLVLGEERTRAREMWSVVKLAPMSYAVVNPTPQIRFLLTGAAPHGIDARNAKALHFFAGGSEVFAKHVDHPGMAANADLLSVLYGQKTRAEAALDAFGIAYAVSLDREIMNARKYR